MGLFIFNLQTFCNFVSFSVDWNLFLFHEFFSPIKQIIAFTVYFEIVILI